MLTSWSMVFHAVSSSILGNATLAQASIFERANSVGSTVVHQETLSSEDLALKFLAMPLCVDLLGSQRQFSCAVCVPPLDNI